jgi:8-oxo-dGTP pyrophosphatase MutT (NUDIX family)
MRKLKSCGVLVFRREPLSFLLMKHPHRYDLPKGHVKAGETELACALRELHEETGISEEQIHMDPEFRFELTYRTRYRRFGGEFVEKTVVILLAWLLADEVEPKATEHTSHEWFEWSPPHHIQAKTIDPLLAEVRQHFDKLGKKPANAAKGI